MIYLSIAANHTRLLKSNGWPEGMSGDPKLTDERLRNWLNGDQPSRERLCRAVMAMDPQYQRVEPRRPEGGPDGGRDIQAVDTNFRPIWGAVGFRNSVSDSSDDRRVISKKCRDDIDAALTEFGQLKAFAFFTNVDLRPSEIEALRQYANAKAITHIDIYWRERIGRALDSVEGLGLRFQYLKIPLSEAEQISFFGRFGSQIESLITTNQERLETRLAGIEFGIATTYPFRSLELTVDLQEAVTLSDLADASILIEMSLPNRDMLFVHIESVTEDHVKPPKTNAKCWLWSDPDSSVGGGQSRVNLGRLRFHVSCSVRVTDRQGMPITFGSLEGCPMSIYLTKPMAACARQLELLLNDFVSHKVVVQSSESPSRRSWWDKGLPEELKNLDWYSISLLGGAAWTRRIALQRKHLRIVRSEGSTIELKESTLLGSHEFVDRTYPQDKTDG